MAYLVDTIAPNGTAVALTGYIMRNDMTGWTKHPRRIEWLTSSGSGRGSRASLKCASQSAVARGAHAS